jgi:uncharacterized protein YndB with AHSA1/START domain
MSVVAVTRLVQAPIDRVWSVLTDLPARADWLSTVYRVELRTPGDFGPGTVWREHRMMPDGDRVTEEFRVEECAPMERFVLSSPSTGADHRLTYTLAPIQTATLTPIPIQAARSAGTPTRFVAGTEVSAVLEGSASGATNRLLALVLGGFAASVVEGALRRDLADLAAATVDGMADSAAGTH